VLKWNSAKRNCVKLDLSIIKTKHCGCSVLSSMQQQQQQQPPPPLHLSLREA
jgi:hypothetical protein